MDYKPSEAEKNLAAVLQMLAALLLFLPGLAVLRTRSGKRPYARYWAKVSVVWSIIVALLAVSCIVVKPYVGTSAPLILVLSLHVLFSVIGALGAAVNTPFGYLFVGNLFCRLEMASIWYEFKLRLPESGGRSSESPETLDEESGYPR